MVRGQLGGRWLACFCEQGQIAERAEEVEDIDPVVAEICG